MAVNNSSWSDASTPQNAAWARTSGIDTSISEYDDATLSYDEATEYYDGYDATTITTEDVKFGAWTNSGTPSNSSWSASGTPENNTWTDSGTPQNTSWTDQT